MKNLLLLLLITVGPWYPLQAQNYVTVEIDTLFWKYDFNHAPKSINGVPITRKDTVIQVLLAPEFDSVQFAGDGFVRCRFRKGERYLLRFNPCSSYELLPVHDAKPGMLRTRIMGSDTNQFFISELYPRPILKNEKDEYYYEPPSGMCQFARRDFELVNEKGEMVTKISFHYLHGEKMTLHYNSDSEKSSITLDGYAKGRRYLKTRVYYDEN